MKSVSSMSEELHKLCNFSIDELHKSLIGDYRGDTYPSLMDTKTEAGKRIKAARLHNNMTLDEVCAKIPGLLASRLSNWEHGRNMVGVDEAKKLAPVLGVSAAYLLTLEDAPDNQRERSLIDLYRHSDDRGKDTIFRVAEQESTYPVNGEENAERAA